MKGRAALLAAGLAALAWSVETSSGRVRAEPGVPGPGAVATLVEAARAQATAGRTSQAAATLERALNIDPGDPLVWYGLAELRLRQGRARQAEQLAMKSASLPRASPPLRARSWRLVARARSLRGNDDGARLARSQAARLASPSP